jgi:hypothetical protein
MNNIVAAFAASTRTTITKNHHRSYAYMIVLLIVLCITGMGSAAESAIDTTLVGIHDRNDRESVTYDSIGKASYDSIFLQTAQLSAAVDRLGSMQSNMSLTIDPAAIKKALHLSTIKSFSTIAKALESRSADTGSHALEQIKIVNVVLKKSSQLQDSIQTLQRTISTCNPIIDLTRYKSYKAAEATNALKSASATLSSSSDRLQTITEQANSLARQIVDALKAE